MFQLEVQEEADKTPPFRAPRKVTFDNGIVIYSRWYTLPKFERSEVKLRPDVRLDNGIVIPAAHYKKPNYGGAWGRMTKEDVKAMDREYLDLVIYARKYGLTVSQVPLTKIERFAFENSRKRRRAA